MDCIGFVTGFSSFDPPVPVSTGGDILIPLQTCIVCLRVFLWSGVNRHFHMICIRDKFSQNIGRQVSSSVIWDHLGTMYDMQALVRAQTHAHASTSCLICFVSGWVAWVFACNAAWVGNPAISKHREELLPAWWYNPGSQRRWVKRRLCVNPELGN